MTLSLARVTAAIDNMAAKLRASEFGVRAGPAVALADAHVTAIQRCAAELPAADRRGAAQNIGERCVPSGTEPLHWCGAGRAGVVVAVMPRQNVAARGRHGAGPRACGRRRAAWLRWHENLKAAAAVHGVGDDVPARGADASVAPLRTHVPAWELLLARPSTGMGRTVCRSCAAGAADHLTLVLST